MARGRQGRDPVKERRWRRLLRGWRRSGLSVRKFCDWHALSEPSFYSWRRELGKRDREAASRRASRRNGLATDTAQFLPVHILEEAVPDSPASRCVEVQLPFGVRLRVPKKKNKKKKKQKQKKKKKKKKNKKKKKKNSLYKKYIYIYMDIYI